MYTFVVAIFMFHPVLLHCVSKKHATTFSTISLTRTVRLQQFLAHLLPRVQAINRCFYFPDFSYL